MPQRRPFGGTITIMPVTQITVRFRFVLDLLKDSILKAMLIAMRTHLPSPIQTNQGKTKAKLDFAMVKNHSFTE